MISPLDKTIKMYIVAPLFEAPTKIALDMYTFHSRAVIPGM